MILIIRSAPGGVISLILIALFLPSTSPAQDIGLWTHIKRKFSKSAFKKIDGLGAVLLLAFSVLLVFALEEVGSRYSWSRPTIIIALVFSAVAGAGFVGWEWWVERQEGGKMEAVFPLRLVRGRVLGSIMA